MHTVCNPLKPLLPANRAHPLMHTDSFILCDLVGDAHTEMHKHSSSCTWLNVTVRHILICRRYRVNDGHAVTFTQAREFLQTTLRAEGRWESLICLWKDLVLSCHYGNVKNSLSFPRRLGSLCTPPSLSGSFWFALCDNTSVSLYVCLLCEFRREWEPRGTACAFRLISECLHLPHAYFQSPPCLP